MHRKEEKICLSFLMYLQTTLDVSLCSDLTHLICWRPKVETDRLELSICFLKILLLQLGCACLIENQMALIFFFLHFMLTGSDSKNRLLFYKFQSVLLVQWEAGRAQTCSKSLGKRRLCFPRTQCTWNRCTLWVWLQGVAVAATGKAVAKSHTSCLAHILHWLKSL